MPLDCSCYTGPHLTIQQYNQKVNTNFSNLMASWLSIIYQKLCWKKYYLGNFAESLRHPSHPQIYLLPDQQRTSDHLLFKKKFNYWGTRVPQSVKCLTLDLAQVMISGSWDWAPHQAPRLAGILLKILSLPLPRHPPPAHALSEINLHFFFIF